MIFDKTNFKTVKETVNNPFFEIEVADAYIFFEISSGLSLFSDLSELQAEPWFSMAEKTNLV